MNDELKERLKSIIARICELTDELGHLQDWDDPHELSRPATPEQIAQIERVAGFPLPPDYRAFLELHNGWHEFVGENDILAAEQMTPGAMADSIADTRSIQEENDDPALRGFIINASISGSDIAYIDPATQRPDGTADVVRWDPRAREYHRSPSFMAYLEHHVELLQRRIAKERAKLR
ncbi:SMI1/KNR4 family protein [Pseudorhodoferax sp.]|uniref:SMI1/KNR4 family protein n=1 Tax=Pseudorhodoferax sp. TaxID=1993553 RepID=UPI0039E49FA3